MNFLKDFAQLEQFVADADLVLVGLGQEWIPACEEILADLEQHAPAVAQLYEWAARHEEYSSLTALMDGYYDHVFFLPRLKDAYKSLLELVVDKNYFIISLGTDSGLGKMKFKADRVVNPCGTYDLLQCNACCENELYRTEELFGGLYHTLDQLRMRESGLSPEELEEEALSLAAELYAIKCNKCQEKIVFNTLDAVKYNENGYLKKWQIYMKWLQGTVNKKLCVIEAGVGLELPSVIRWPFEKTVFYNQKATLVRIHHKFYQVNEEISERAYGMEKNAVDFFCRK